MLIISRNYFGRRIEEEYILSVEMFWNISIVQNDYFIIRENLEF